MKTAQETTESYLTRIAEMPRQALIREILTFRCTFTLDFTRAYLDRQSTDRLRHILGAALMHCAR
jgi:hypothetical protein